MMRCQRLFALLSEFIDEQLGEDVCHEIEAHLADCDPCQAFYRTLEKTVEICQDLPSRPMSEELRKKLSKTLQAEFPDWKAEPPCC